MYFSVQQSRSVLWYYTHTEMSTLPIISTCRVCEIPPVYRCACRAAYYCSAAHREIDWPAHSVTCTWVDTTISTVAAVDGLLDRINMVRKGYPGWLMTLADTKTDIENHIYVVLPNGIIPKYGERDVTVAGDIIELPVQKSIDCVVRAFLDECNTRLNKAMHDPLQSLFSSKSKTEREFENTKYTYDQGRILLGGASEMFSFKVTDTQQRLGWKTHLPMRGVVFKKETRVINASRKQKNGSSGQNVTLTAYVGEEDPTTHHFYTSHVTDVDSEGKPKYVLKIDNDPSLSCSPSSSTPKPLSSIVDKSRSEYNDDSSSSSSSSSARLIQKGQSVYDAAAGK
jgi:hypothetical protein